MVEESDLFGLFRINWLKTQPDAQSLSNVFCSCERESPRRKAVASKLVSHCSVLQLATLMLGTASI
jgi:hypothetical protein